MLNPPMQISIQSLLCKTTICLTRPATTFFLSNNEKKTCLKQPLQTLPSEEIGNKHKATMHKK